MSCALTGCFIPWPFHPLVTPQVRFEVGLADGGAPIPNARIRLVRHRYPYGARMAVFEAATDDAGIATFTERREWEVGFPFMMHGVWQYGFTYCVDAEAGTGWGQVLDPDRPQVLPVLLPGAECEADSDSDEGLR